MENVRLNELPRKKHKFDKEYKCTYPLEMCWLTDNGIRYEFVKIENGITVWKYTKTKSLALALAEFWGSMDKRNYK